MSAMIEFQNFLWRPAVSPGVFIAVSPAWQSNTREMSQLSYWSLRLLFIVAHKSQLPFPPLLQLHVCSSHSSHTWLQTSQQTAHWPVAMDRERMWTAHFLNNLMQQNEQGRWNVILAISVHSLILASVSVLSFFCLPDCLHCPATGLCPCFY